ncbi:hypothetical protein E2562_016620 [Oryza meyeriana var. granulata]|uniref:Uncharacterized protein n=1 Tax=Oryza meyeriana var. granulata TaxID=110450 RepID=A0A6G1EM36_9ORYZ|nr:hypothetical protein E2562_016620 [Oryza meyeriana var. granulata]
MAAAMQCSSSVGEARVAAIMTMSLSEFRHPFEADDFGEADALLDAEADKPVVVGVAEGEEEPAASVGAEVAGGACVVRDAEAVGAAAADGTREGRTASARDEDPLQRALLRRRRDGRALGVAGFAHVAPVDEARRRLWMRRRTSALRSRLHHGASIGEAEAGLAGGEGWVVVEVERDEDAASCGVFDGFTSLLPRGGGGEEEWLWFDCLNEEEEANRLPTVQAVGPNYWAGLLALKFGPYVVV